MTLHKMLKFKSYIKARNVFEFRLRIKIEVIAADVLIYIYNTYIIHKVHDLGSINFINHIKIDPNLCCYYGCVHIFLHRFFVNALFL